jgi:hypothetical protein
VADSPNRKTARPLPTLGGVEPLFEKNVGADRISDLLGKLSMREIIAYTQQTLEAVDTRIQLYDYRFGRAVVRLPRNPYNKQPILLVPQSVLRDLPIAADWSQIDYVTAVNAEVRDRFHQIIGHTWKDAMRVPKNVVKRLLLREPELLRDLLSKYHAKPARRYDFEKDPSGRANWHRIAKEVAAENPLHIDRPLTLTTESVNAVVVTIVNKYKQLVEDNKLWKGLYHDGKPKSEEAAQLLFFAVASSYCEANDLDISPETDAGRGEVDFKISHGAKRKVVVELKLTTNPRLVHGYHTQVREYAKAERTKLMHYVVLDVDGGSPKRIENLMKEIRLAEQLSDKTPVVTIINAHPQKPASKA